MNATIARQTARNNAFLKACRKLFNKPIYAAMLVTMNETIGTLEQRTEACKTWLTSRGCTTDPAALLARWGIEWR